MECDCHPSVKKRGPLRLFGDTLLPHMERPSPFLIIWLSCKAYSHLHSTLLPQVTGRLNEPAAGAALRESHPSEDLSELPPLLVAVAGQRVQADGIIAKQLARAALGWVGTARHLLWPSLIGVGGGEVSPPDLRAPTGGSQRTRRIAVPPRGGPSVDVIRRRIWPPARRFSSCTGTS